MSGVKKQVLSNAIDILLNQGNPWNRGRVRQWKKYDHQGNHGPSGRRRYGYQRRYLV